MRNLGRTLFLLPLPLVLFVAVLVLKGQGDAPKPATTAGVAASVPASGMLAAIDPETGTLTQPTPEQIRELQSMSAGSEAQKSRAQTFELEGGGEGAHLDESFDHYATVHRGADGKLHTDCDQGQPHLEATADAEAATPPPEM